MTDRGEQPRGPVGGRAWGDAFAQLTTARAHRELEGEELERLAVAAYMVGEDDACEAAWQDAHSAWLRRGDRDRAARCAFWQALGLLFRGDLAPAMGWIGRGGRVLEGGPRDSRASAWLLLLDALPVLFQGDAETARRGFLEAGALAERHGDTDGIVLARLGMGVALVAQGQAADGMALLDEVMVSVSADDVSPILAGIAYCQVIAVCWTVFDVRRASEWTSALSRWCDAQPDLVPFRGNCLVHRCEIFQLRGAWRDAGDEARRACEWLEGPPTWDALGSAHYQLGEIQRLRGEDAEAEASYRNASLAGRDPEPGLSLLWLGRGRVDLALSSIRRVLDEAAGPFERSRVLPAAVEILLEAGEIAAARSAADELDRSAGDLDAPYLHAVAGQTSGAVLLAEGEPKAALLALRRAHAGWRELEAPHRAACARVLIGVACRALGDASTAALEFDAAEAAFRELGAEPDRRRTAALAVPASTEGVLSRRETEVLTLVAAGKSNRAVAEELVISEKTVARHLSNIFAKLGLSSRSEATAYAYRTGLVR